MQRLHRHLPQGAAGMKPLLSELYLTVFRDAFTHSGKSLSVDDNYRCSKGLRSNSLTGSLAPRRRRPPRRPQHSLPCFMHPGAQRPWQLTRSPRRRGRAATAAWSRPSALAVDQIDDQFELGRLLDRQVSGLQNGVGALCVDIDPFFITRPRQLVAGGGQKKQGFCCVVCQRHRLGDLRSRICDLDFWLLERRARLSI